MASKHVSPFRHLFEVTVRRRPGRRPLAAALLVAAVLAGCNSPQALPSAAGGSATSALSTAATAALEASPSPTPLPTATRERPTAALPAGVAAGPASTALAPVATAPSKQGTPESADGTAGAAVSTPLVADARNAAGDEAPRAAAEGGAAEPALRTAPGAAADQASTPSETVNQVGRGTGNQFLVLFPELQTAAGPAWLAEGARATYYLQSATVNVPRDATGSAGAGYMQYSVVALDRSSAVASAKYYMDTGSGLMPSMILPSIGIPGAGDFWIAPQVLPDAEKVANKDLAVVHMPTTVAGQTYQAVRFEYTHEDARYVWMFDEKSGLLLHYGQAVGAEDQPNRQLANMDLVGFRQLAIPWRARSAPAWVTEGRSFTYGGAWTTRIPNSPAFPLPYTLTTQYAASRGRWTEAQLSSVLNGQNQGSQNRVTGVAQLFDSLWLPAEALTTLRDGQILDDDPVTKAIIGVSVAQDGAVVLTETLPTCRSAMSYDPSTGALVGFKQDWQAGIATNSIEVSLSRP